jgi:peptidoglycan/xylan/chitin deacetylase (PgdA/CDA1 family)
VKPGVFITFDVECSMGGAWGNPALRPVPPARAVWGEYGNERYGLPLIVEILDRYGLSGTFFVEAFIDEQGYPGQSEPICRYLLDHGQDVQLHIHPNHKHYGLKQQGKPYPFTDDIADLPPHAQRELLDEGARRLTQWTGRRPVAFRAGNMGASEETLRQLAAVGIPIDSSYTFAYAGGRCRFPAGEPYNGSKRYDGVLELALSGFCKPRLPGLQRAKPLDLVGISFAECRDAIRSICRAGADAVMILHSFSLLKVRNVQYDGGRPNRIVSRRFRRFCEWLAGPAGPPVYTFSRLAEAMADGAYQARSVPPCRLAHPRAIVRKAVQAVNNLYWV